jgi:hypothetical protein
MKKTLLILCALCASARVSFSADAPTALRWEVETARPQSHALTLYRGESVRLEPQFLSYDAAVDLSAATNVTFRYRTADMVASNLYYAIAGVVTSASTGYVSIPWTPSCEGVSNDYDYTVAVAFPGGYALRGFGTLTLEDTIGGSATSNPTVYHQIDWATVDNVNLASAPFASTSTVAALSDDYLRIDGAAAWAGYQDANEYGVTNVGLIRGMADSGPVIYDGRMRLGLQVGLAKRALFGTNSTSETVAKACDFSDGIMRGNGEGWTNVADATVRGWYGVTSNDVFTLQGQYAATSNAVSALQSRCTTNYLFLADAFSTNVLRLSFDGTNLVQTVNP